MKATGIVRRIEEYGIIGQNEINPYKYRAYGRFIKKFLIKTAYFDRYIAKTRGFPSFLFYIIITSFLGIFRNISAKGSMEAAFKKSLF